MRVCGVAARDAPAAPSSFAQLLNDQFFKGERLSALALNTGLPATTVVDAKYSTAPSRLSQHLFFDREHHARPQDASRGVVRGDGEERAPLVQQRDVRAVLPTARGRDRRAVAHAGRLLCR